MMRKTIFVFILTIALAGTPVMKSFGQEAGPNGLDLAGILVSGWQAFKSDKPGFTGGLAMQVLSPRGDYFLSTGMGGVTNGHHFRIASVTKTFTAAAIMLLHQQGALDIDDKITDNIPGKDIPYVPDTPEYAVPYKKDITIRHLLMHRAGVFDISNNIIPENDLSRGEPYAGKDYLDYMMAIDKEHNFTFDELVGIDAKNQLSFFKPGTSYHYSDTGYMVLGKIIERVSGKAYDNFIEAELLIPNGLLDTYIPYKGVEQTLPKPFVRGYVWADGKALDVTESNMSAHTAEGDIISSPGDLADWCRRLFKGEAGLTKETVEMMKKGMDMGDGKGTEYGLGTAYTPGIGYGHAGAHQGYLTLMYYNPDTDVAFVMFTNMWDVRSGLDTIKAEFQAMLDIAKKIIGKMGY